MITRRTVLAATLAGTVVRARAASRKRVIVIGAGFAGLAAARELATAGHEVTVLEARDRIGGRIHTSTVWPNLPVDLGASWIHGLKGNPATELARQAGVAITETRYDSAIYLGPDGRPVEPDVDAVENLLGKALDATEDLERDISLMEALERSAGWKKADAASRHTVLHFVNTIYEQEYSGSARRLSAWYGDEGESFGGADGLPVGGYAPLVQLLADGLDIRLGQRVETVVPGSVIVAGGARFEADAILVTVPVGVLKAGSIRFAQPLSRKRRDATAALEMGLLNKTWLRFDRIAWPHDVDWIEWMGPETGKWALWYSLARVLDQPVLLGFHAADEAAALERLDDRATVDAATAALRAMFGSAFPAPVAAQVTRWGKDPFSLGSYSFNAVGVDEDTRAALAGEDWDGGLWFAGEACSTDYFGTVHGAILSGREVAREMN